MESGPCKTTLQVLMCSDWSDLLPKTIHFLPFRWPCCYSGLWAGTAPHPAGIGIAPGAGGLPAARLSLHSACFPLNPLILSPWAYPSVLKLAQSWENHRTLLEEGDRVPDAARIAQECSVFCTAAGSFWGCNTKSFKRNHTSRSDLSTQVSG